MACGYNDMLVPRQDLQDFAWSEPMRDLASKVGLSDVGMKKLLTSYGIVTPPQGHWNKVHAGRPVPKCPKVPARGPGETGRICVDRRFATILTAAGPIPSSGPFASAEVPEDLEELYATELKAVGRVAVPRKLERYHQGLAEIQKHEERRRAKVAASSWHWDAPKFDNPVDRRRLRLLNAIFMALSRRGHGGSAYDRDGEIHAAASVGDMHLGLVVEVSSKRLHGRAPHRVGQSTDLPASTPLMLVIDPGFDRKNALRWEDDASGTLETRLAEIIARIIASGEEKFRRGLKEAEEREEQFRRWQEQQRREELERRNAERLKQLRESGYLLRQAEDLRAMIARVRSAVLAGSINIESARLEEWERWASAEANRLYPILSGQVMTHLATAKE